MSRKLKSYAEWRRQENLEEYTFYTKKLERLLLTMFEWDGLPSGISQRFLEETLYKEGVAVFYYDTDLGFYVVAKGTPIGINNYNEPTGFRVISADNTINKILEAKDCIPIYNDYFMQGNEKNVHFFAKKLSEIEKTVNVNLEQLKHPYILACNEQQKETIQAVIEKKVNGEPYILVNDDFMNAVNSVKVFNLDIPDHTGDLQDLKHEYINEALTFFGINNVNVIKKERLVSGETDQNNEQIFLDRNVMLKARRDACKKINEKYNLDLSVSLATDKEKEETGELL